MHRIAAKFVPRVLTQDQKDSGVAICQELKETVKNDPTLLLNVIRDKTAIFAVEESWVTKTQKSTYAKSKLKMMLICFFDQEGIVHQEFVPPGMMVNSDFYCDVLRRLRENVWHKRPQKW